MIESISKATTLIYVTVNNLSKRAFYKIEILEEHPILKRMPA